MHKTLTVRTNLILIGNWALVIIVLLYVGMSASLNMALSFMAIGLFIGGFQSMAMHSTPKLFLVTKTALEVRKATLSSAYGKLSIGILWLVVMPLLIWLTFLNRELFTSIWAYVTMAIMREAASLPGLLFLARHNDVAS